MARYSNIFRLISDETSSSERALTYFHIMYQSIFCIEHLLFFSFFFKLLYLSTQFLCLLICLSLEVLVAHHPVLELYLFLSNQVIAFRHICFCALSDAGMMVTVNKAMFSLQKILLTFSKIPALG